MNATSKKVKSLTNKQFLAYLKEKRACNDAIEWVGKRNLKQVWDECPRGDWMMWLVAKSGNYTLEQITAIKVDQVRLVQHLIKDQRSTSALKVAERFSRGTATREELNDAYIVAYAAASAYAAAYADDDADDATYDAAFAAYAAAYAAASAADDDAYADDDAAYAAAYAAACAADDDARTETRLKTANICRKHIKEIEL